MFSLLDALLDQNINQIVASLSLPDLVSDGLFELASEPAIRLNIIRSMEQGDWVQLNALLASVDLDAEKIASVYAEAVQWTDEKIALINSPA
jgi:c-di-GMP-related signal transduction protein